MELKEIDQEIARLTALREKAEREEASKAVRVNHQEAVAIYERLISDIRRLDELGYVPPKLQAALTDGKGKFNPGMYIKKPRLPA